MIDRYYRKNNKLKVIEKTDIDKSLLNDIGRRL